MTTVLVAIGFGLLGGAIAFFVGAMIAGVVAMMLHMSSMEGGSGFFAAGIGMMTGVAGMIVSIILAVRWRGGASFASVVRDSLLSLIGIVLVTAIGLWIYYESRPHYLQPASAPPQLKFQILPPAGTVVPTDNTGFAAELQTRRSGNDAVLKSDESPEVQGQRVLGGYVQLLLRISPRHLALTLPTGEVRVFRLRLPADPTDGRYREWSDWQKADVAGANGQTVPVPKGPDYQIRYRVETHDMR
jgi:hypothetical protein